MARKRTTTTGERVPRGKTTRRGTTYEAGRSTRAAIVRAAETVLAEHGHAQFSVQRVAQQLRISPGNVNYYFPTRSALLEAMILDILDQYRQRTLTIERRGAVARSADFQAILQWLMTDAASDYGSRLFRQLWAIAAGEPRIAQAMDDFYARSVRGHLERLDIPPASRAAQSDYEAIMVLVHMISEGTTVLFGTKPRSNALLARVQAQAARAIAHLVNEAERQHAR